MAERELVDGGFYWISYEGRWAVAEHERIHGRPHFWLARVESALSIENITEVGPCVGKEPPPFRRLGKDVTFDKYEMAGRSFVLERPYHGIKGEAVLIGWGGSPDGNVVIINGEVIPVRPAPEEGEEAEEEIVKAVRDAHEKIAAGLGVSVEALLARETQRPEVGVTIDGAEYMVRPKRDITPYEATMLGLFLRWEDIECAENVLDWLAEHDLLRHFEAVG